jgi:hypothetical protein
MSEAATTTDSAAERRGDADVALTEIIHQQESTDWGDVPGVSAAEAAAWTNRLIEARDRVRAGENEGDGD